MAEWLEGPKTAKRRMKCRLCGREISKGEEYWLWVYRDGPYLRRNAVCPECARRIVVGSIRERVTVAKWQAMEECIHKMAPTPGRNAIETTALLIVAGEAVRRAKEEWCEKYVDKNGFYVDLPKWLCEAAQHLGISVDVEVERFDKRAIARCQWG